MAEKTLAQKQADRQLDEALQRMVQAYKMNEGHTLVDYVVALDFLNMQDTTRDDPPESFGLAFRNGVCRSSVAIGMLTKGLVAMRGGFENFD
jgi:hypothetical protein